MCTFLNQLETSEKTCRIEYGLSGEEMTKSLTAANTTSNTVLLELELDGLVRNYQFVVTASNGTYTVMVEGNIRGIYDNLILKHIAAQSLLKFISAEPRAPASPVIIVPITVVVMLIIVLFTIGAIILRLHKRKIKNGTYVSSSTLENFELKIHSTNRS